MEGKPSPTSCNTDAQVDERWVQNFYEEFYEDVFEEVAQFGEIENLNVCDNIADHMVGNVYIKFRDEEAAAKALQVGEGESMRRVSHGVHGPPHAVGGGASFCYTGHRMATTLCFAALLPDSLRPSRLQALQGRYYDGRPIIVEFSPVTDFREATCRQYEENTCNRGGYCNFMHLKPIS